MAVASPVAAVSLLAVASPTARIGRRLLEWNKQSTMELFESLQHEAEPLNPREPNQGPPASRTLTPSSVLAPLRDHIAAENRFLNTVRCGQVTPDLLTQATKYIQTHHSLEILQCVYHCPATGIACPSWIPPCPCPPWWCTRYREAPWEACGNRKWVEPVPHSLSRYLSSHGVAFDTVVEVQKNEGRSDWARPPFSGAGSWSALFTTDNPTYHTGEPLISVIACTLLGFEDPRAFEQLAEGAAQIFLAWLTADASISNDDLRNLQRLVAEGDLVPAYGNPGDFQARFVKENLLALTRHFDHVPSCGRPLFRTENGYIGTGPRLVQPGDVCCVLFGGKVPFILRPVSDHFLLIGKSYVHGAMHGEIIDRLDSGELEERLFEVW
ncbi:uncharacterized protein A1O5_03902 [Cladophialophora psammophila CBS 110553]|uniref:Heterokaryon incompatibility domain-containing protein n=1 Tax=Cladophialophora psammophila CBS 110553 TaxID=1182543 RepID=W9X5Y7_9EURO|nr:uncharacterized protein A1O5_03902 [Cladophialophora psammophila CBS 110553]EXJ72755.1 hypothetical protein A1O5_03902 [Cladophialophora psammophila CBS 110553]